MMRPLRWVPVVLGFLVLGAAHFGLAARAEDGATPAPTPGTWVYDVRVVRVDPTASTVLEAAPTWKSASPADATTIATWSDLLAGLKGRGRTVILLDQRLTGIESVPTNFSQRRKRMVLSLQQRATNAEHWSSSYVETGTSGHLKAGSGGLHYGLEVSWEETPTEDGSGPLGSVSWEGSHTTFAAGQTLVLSHRQQQVQEGQSPGLEIYAFVTASLAPK
jgi:hypothetical protein